VYHGCALNGGDVRCWGFGGEGRLGYANTETVGDNETPGAAGPVNLGDGRTATAIGAGEGHTCARLDDGNVRCWGFGAEGRLGYGNTRNVGDDEHPGSVGPVDLGPFTALAISAGQGHTCAVLDGGSVRCWGFGADGRLGYGNANTIGDNEPPANAGPVNLGPGRTAVAISAGGFHTCAQLDNGDVRCWGFGGQGRLGYKSTANIGDTEPPADAGPVNLGAGRTAKAISAGGFHTCALLDDDTVRCWGWGANGRLGYGNVETIGDDETPADAGPPVDLGPGRTAKAISAGGFHTCALLDNNTVRCWGYGFNGQLGYASTTSVGDNELPGSVGPVELGAGRTAVAISAGESHTCARLDDGSVRCWGFGANHRLGRGVCNEYSVGDDEKPDWVEPLDLQPPGSVGPSCNAPGGPPPTAPATGGQSAASPAAGTPALAAAPGGGPGRITGLRARGVSRSKVVLTFRAPESDGANSPAATTYLVKQARRPIRGARRFRRARTLCKGRCQFSPPRVGARIKLTVTDLRPRTTYYYAVAARATVPDAVGPRSRTVKAKTR